MSKKEEILLDATLLEEIRYPTFRAKLGNGHQIVAFAKGPVQEKQLWKPGLQVCVAMSPFDMSKGRIVRAAGGEKIS